MASNKFFSLRDKEVPVRDGVLIHMRN